MARPLRIEFASALYHVPHPSLYHRRLLRGAAGDRHAAHERPARGADVFRDARKFVYDRLDGETLWAASMPCVGEDGARIPIARYGSSNAGRMKSVYRRGLGHRYGRTMQVIRRGAFQLLAARRPLVAAPADRRDR